MQESQSLTTNDLAPDLSDDEVALRERGDDPLRLDYVMEAKYDWIDARVKVEETDDGYRVDDLYVHFRKMRAERETVEVDSVGDVVHELSKRLKIPAEDFVSGDAEDSVASGVHSVVDEYDFETRRGKLAFAKDMLETVVGGSNKGDSLWP